MAGNTNPIFILTANVSAVTIVPADTTAKKTVWTAGSNGGVLTGISVTSDDTVSRDLNVYVTLGGTDYQVGQVNIPITAGVSTTPSVNLLSLGLCPWLNPDGSWTLPASAIVKVAAVATITAAKTITIVGHGGDF
jgi:hypothetical protein